MDIEGWLRGLGLERYAEPFRANDIRADVLPDLTDAELKELGVSLGDRKRLLKAISELATPVPASPPEQTGAPPEPQPPPQAERRQLTVMFVDLVGSTAMSSRLDPEELRQVIRSYQDACAGLITRFEGFVAKYLGDGVLAYFGWPRAHEDEAERAVRAGLAIAEAVAKLGAPGAPLSARVGIATGLVVVGDLLGEGSAREEAVVGETPNLAARLQQLAGPGQVIIAETTRRLLGGRFDLADLGALEVKGFATSVRGWRVLGEIPAAGRFEARRAVGLTPLVGREHEIALLRDRWELAHEGEGQAVLLAGEPGIGKSRIAEALYERLDDEPHACLRYQCSPHHADSALFPIIGQLEHAAGFRRDDSAETRLAKLEALLAEGTGDASAIVPLFAALLAVPTGERYPPLDLAPQQRKEKTLEALLAQLERLAVRHPVLLVFEDLHWIDPTSLEFLGLLVDRAQSLPVLAVLTFRPEFAPSWTDRSHVTLLTLNRLGRRQAAALAEWVGGGKALPPEVVEQIVAKTDGVPLFVEELTRTVLESGLLQDAGDRYVLSGPLPPLAIPATLHDSLMARLDRLAPVREVAQLASCIGRDFSHELLAAISPLKEDELRGALDQLAGSELILRRGGPPGATYAFRHALVQEAAYGSLLKSRRQQVHGRLAQAVEERFPEIAELQPEWLAHHYTEAGLAEPAAGYWLKAGRRAKEAYANREAVSHLRKCLETIERQEAHGGVQAPHLAQQQLQALVLLGDLASVAGDLEEANRCYERASDLPSDAAVRTWIENKRHRPRIAVRDGARIAFYEHGGGPDTLVFVAPLAYGLAAFQPLVERLCQEFRIVTVDSRGTGASDPLTRPYWLSEQIKDLCAVLAMLGSGPVVGVGISRGANLLFKLAHAQPQLFAKLVAIGGPPGLPSPPFFSEERLQQGRDLFEKGDVEGIIRFHTSLVFSEPTTRELRELFIQNRRQLPRETILSFFDPDPTVDVTALLPDIAVPTLVAHGREDQLIKFAAAEFIATRLPNAQLYAFEGRGHLPLFTAPDEFCDVLRSFVRTGTVERRPSRGSGSPGLKVA